MPQVRDTNQRRDATAAFPFMRQPRSRGCGERGDAARVRGVGAVGNCGGVASLSAAVGVAWQAAPKMLQHNSQHVAQFCHEAAVAVAVAVDVAACLNRCVAVALCLPHRARACHATPGFTLMRINIDS